MADFDVKKVWKLKDKDADRSKYLKEILWKFVKNAKTGDDILNAGLQDFFKAVLPENYADDFCRMVTRLIGNYTYGTSYWRRSHRSDNPVDYWDKLFILIESIYFDWKDFDLAAYLKMSNEEKSKKDFAELDSFVVSMIASLKIDQGDEVIIEIIKDIICSDTNFCTVDYHLIRTVAMSRNEQLYELMRNLLLAAKLQEGLRQSILENADAGTIEYFKLIIKTVLDHNLLRFSAAVRAVCVWTGFPSEGDVDKRVIEKLLSHGYEYIEDENKRNAAINSGDVVHMYGAMWAESVYGVQGLYKHIEKYLEGKKYQRLVAAYFINNIESDTILISLSDKVFCSNESDLDVLLFIINEYSRVLSSLAPYNRNYINGKWEHGEVTVKHDKYPEILKNKKIRNSHFEFLSGILKSIPKNGHTVNEKPFSLIRCELLRETVFHAMQILAVYDYDSEKEKELHELLTLVDGNAKSNFIDYFIIRNQSEQNKQLLLEFLSDKSMPVRVKGVDTLGEYFKLKTEDILKIEELLSLKTGEIRQSALKVIGSAGNDELLSSAKRLISDSSANKRLAGLDLLMLAKKLDIIKIDEINVICENMTKKTEPEEIIIKSLLDTAVVYNIENGYGLYDYKYKPDFPPIAKDKKYNIAAFGKIGEKEIKKMFNSLLKLIEKNKDYAYKAIQYDGVKDSILGNTTRLERDKGEPDDWKYENCVLSDLWLEWVSKQDVMVIRKLRYLMNVNRNHSDYCNCKGWSNPHNIEYTDFSKKLMMKLRGGIELETFIKDLYGKPFAQLAFDIIERVPVTHSFDLYYGILSDLFLTIPEDEWRASYIKNEDCDKREVVDLSDIADIAHLISHIGAHNDDNINKKVMLFHNYAKIYDFQYIWLETAEIACAVNSGIVDKGELRRFIIRTNDTRTMSRFTEIKYKTDREIAEKYPCLVEAVADVASRVIEIELKRGDMPTDVSGLAKAISRHKGAKNFAEILVALGNETLTRGYSWSGENTKRDVLSSLLKASVPDENDNAETLRAALNNRVSEKRLLEAVMYSPSWISIAEDYLGWEGLKCAAWYFHAHTRASYSVDFETEVARFSPIDKEDFQKGVFDINWFNEAYKMLGKERFGILYDCAKYIASGGTHKRAQLFADAVLDKLSCDELEPQITDKRNNERLMAYSLIPLKKNKLSEALRRYEFIQAYLKKSREFGSMRQASEKTAANVALENLARNMGYTDTLRFTWKMEIEKFEAVQTYFKPHTIGDVTLFLETTDMGKAELVIEKGGKLLKSVPAALKKDNYIKELSEVKSSLKAQFSRARVSLEKAMENCDTFTYGEISELLNHPVICPLIKKLVFVSDNNEFGFLSQNGLSTTDKNEVKLGNKANLRIAHCYDLYKGGKWLDFQRYAFEEKLIQPFKQIFRELYLVNEDEKAEKTISRRYAGNQIQPKKTVALLKTRGWTVDYEEGLQKVYFKENVVAKMYALADWFSPSDMEAPTLETVNFYERKTGKALELEKLDPVMFSEVMRDVDLVVSVAHIGGVDPMASHSTVEMRAVIVGESARLLKLDNVIIDERHVKIMGIHGDYTVHLGSAIAHKMGKGALNILPVHSQQRGKLFLPFLDEDPKTAEIVSKVLLLAEDVKIKDPTVMAQINH